MAYLTLKGEKVEADTAEEVLAKLGSAAFGGPFAAGDYARQLAGRAELGIGETIDPSDFGGIVEALVASGHLKKS